MVTAEELKVEAESKSNAAKVLEEEACKLEEQGLSTAHAAEGKLQEAKDLRDEAQGLRRRALAMTLASSSQQHLGPALGNNDARWNDDGRCPQLAAFVKALAAQKEPILHPVSDTVITLDRNVVWLGMLAVASADLYVRPCYPELFKAREEYIKELKWEQGCMSVFTGTPGVGKSHLAALFVAQTVLNGFDVLLECLEGPIWPPNQLQRQYYWLASSGKVEHTEDQNAARRRLRDSNRPAMYVSDGCPPGIGRNSWTGHSVTFCSPQRALYKPMWKGGDVLYLYVPVLELEELLSMKRALPEYKRLSDQSVGNWYSWAGGTARACLNIKLADSHRLAAWKKEVSYLLAKATKAELLEMIWCDGLFTVPANQTFVEDSDMIFHWFLAAELPEAGLNSPKDGCLGRYRRHSVRFATQNVRNVALINLNLSELAEVALACLDSSKSSTRYWVEVLACKCLQMGQLKLAAALLPEGCKERVRFELSVPTATLQQQSSPQEAAKLCKSDMPVLCLLHAENEPAIDAISDPTLYREVTKAERNDVLSGFMAKMDTATTQAEGGRKAQLLALQGSVTWTDAPVPLSMPLRCFFMPPRHFDVMCESKEPYTESGKPSQAQGSHFPESEVAHQCVVRLPLETILRECRDIVATAKFERLVEELYDEDPGEAMGICALFDAKR